MLCGGSLCHSWALSPSTKGTMWCTPTTFTYVGKSYIQWSCPCIQLTLLCSNHAPKHCSALIFLCTFPNILLHTRIHELWWSLSYIKLLASMFIWCTVAGNTDMAWPLMDHFHGSFLALAWSTIITGSAIGAKKFMYNALEEALSPKRHYPSAVTCALEQRSPRRRVSMLVH